MRQAEVTPISAGAHQRSQLNLKCMLNRFAHLLAPRRKLRAPAPARSTPKKVAQIPQATY
jgi:hypothetical protein